MDGKVNELEAQLASAVSDRSRLQQEVTVLAERLAARDREADTSQGARTPDVSSAGSQPDTTTITLEDGPLSLTREQLTSINLEEIIDVWGKYLTQLEPCSEALETGVISQADLAHARAAVAQYAAEGCTLIMRTANANPVAYRLWMACNMDESSVAGEKEDNIEHWSEVLYAMHLSATQTAQLIQWRQICVASMAHALHDCKLLSEDVTDAMPALVGLRHTSAQYLQRFEVVSELRRMLWAKQVSHLEFVSRIYEEVLKPEQVAQCFIRSWPFMPDLLAIACWAALLNGERDALLVLSPPRHKAVQSNTQPTISGQAR